MTIAESLTKLTSDIGAAYAKIQAKGGTVPENKNTNNLANAIDSITGGGVTPLPEYPYPVEEAELEAGEWGALAYLRDDTVHYYTATDETDLTNLEGTSSSTTTITRVIKTLEDGFDITSRNILAYKFGSATTSTANYFLCACPLLQAVYFNSNSSLTDIGDNFLSKSITLNCPMFVPIGVTRIGSSFLSGCTGFNQPVALPDGVTSSPGYFLDGCSSFNSSLTLPNSLTVINAYFLRNCSAFNQPLRLPDSVKTIYAAFMYACAGFNSLLVLPDGLTNIASSTSAANAFMYGCSSFNQPFQLPASLTVIPQWFMYGCQSFNSTFEIRGPLTTISNYVFRNWASFNQPLTIPSSVTSIGTFFLAEARNFTGPLTVETTAHPTDNDSLSTTSSTAPMYTTGITIQGAGAEAWKAALPDRTSSPYRKLIVAEETA